MENLVRKKMSESKDPKIKLFGQTIQLPENPPPPSTAVDGGGSDAISDHSTAQDLPCSTNSSPEETSLGKSCEELESKKEILNQTLSKDKTKQESELAKKPEEQCEGEKTLKKPDKIIPCPRCNSMETKFCYFNNYNVSQPRHFCKKCQRYWTAGGTMRNVPVGAGRRKNKNIPITPQYRPLLVTETLPNGTHRCIPNNNGNVLTFGEEVDQDQDQSSGSSVTAVNSVEEVKVDPVVPHYPNFPPCFNNGPWAYPVPVMPPGFYPIPFYAPPPPPPYWGCNLAGAWNINPWNIPSKSPVSPILGKRSRDDEGGPGPGPDPKPEKSIWVPKTLRIDDPGEAARSSIWETLGIKYDKGGDPVGRGNSLFKPFRSKKDETTPTSETTSSSVLQANPAALSRSLNFQENA